MQIRAAYETKPAMGHIHLVEADVGQGEKGLAFEVVLFHRVTIDEGEGGNGHAYNAVDHRVPDATKPDHRHTP